MAHRRLYALQIYPAGDEQRAVGMEQIVKAQGSEAGRIAGTLKTPPQRGWIKPAAEAVGEDVLVDSGELGALAQAIQRGSGLIGEGTSRARRLLVELASTPAEIARRTVSL